MSYKRLTPCIFIANGKGVRWFDDKEVVADDVIALAKHYNDNGADELLGPQRAASRYLEHDHSMG